MNDIKWIFSLKNEVPLFLDKLKERDMPGFFHYSLTGDLYSADKKWGLGNTVFAVKIYYTLGLLSSLPEKQTNEMANFILSFQKKDGTIYDPLVKRKAFVLEKLAAVKNFDLNNFWHKQTIIAETRQSLSALKLLNKNIKIKHLNFTPTEEGTREYLESLDWSKPWGAGSHFSHMLFFLENSNLDNKDKLILTAINWVNLLQNNKDGFWYKGNTSVRQKINGAMKIITGLAVVNKIKFKHPEKIIDLCLKTTNNGHACDNFNIIYVLKYANSLVDSGYKFKEIEKFALQRLDIYKKYYFNNLGGFSFALNKSNQNYYGAKITKGLNEPDIHGTIMFLWGISIIAQILKINKSLGFNEQIP